MTIFEYMDIKEDKGLLLPNGDYIKGHYTFTGNDMVQAINKMESIVDEYGVSNLVDFENYAVKQINRNETYYTFWLFGSPETFFRLMGEALDKGVIG